MVQDYYELLQVHPRADAEAVRAAYQRLCGLYDPVRLEGAADDLIAIARSKLAAIEDAYAVLSDPQRRAAYDQTREAPTAAPRTERAESQPGEVATALILDYTPLPPASRTERPSRFQREPARNIPVRRPGLVTAVAVVGSLATVALLVSLLITNWGTLTAPASPAQAAVTPTASILDQYEVAIAQAKQAAEQNPTSVDAWLQYANQLYDSAQIVRENMPDSSLYQQRIPRWLEASAAYSKVLEIEPGNISALSDKGTSLCYYGAGVGDQAFITEGIKNVREAATARADDPLIQLNLGTCLVSALPPQTAEAIQTWQKVVKIAPVDSALAQRARELIDKYQKK